MAWEDYRNLQLKASVAPSPEQENGSHPVGGLEEGLDPSVNPEKWQEEEVEKGLEES